MSDLLTDLGPGDRRPPFRLTGRHVLFGFILFFALVIGANLIFVWVALTTFSGTTSDRAYVEGLDYNAQLAAAAAQQARGWQGDILLDGERLALQLADREGRPVTGLQLTATLGRPATRGFDRVLPLVEVAPGLYAAAVALEAGRWQVTIVGDDPAGGRAFRSDARLWR